MYAGPPKIAQELYFLSYHLRVSSSNWRKYFVVEKHWYIQPYTSDPYSIRNTDNVVPDIGYGVSAEKKKIQS